MHHFHRIHSFRRIILQLLVCLMLLSLCFPCAAEENAELYSYDWFMLPDDSAPIRASVSIFSNESPVLLTEDPAFETQYVWKVHLILEETTGIPFFVEKVTEVIFGADNAILNCRDYIGDEIAMILPGNTVAAGHNLGFGLTILPDAGKTGFGFAVEGTDALGNKLTFTHYVPLSYQINETLTRAHFMHTQEQTDGLPYISITTENNPIPQIYNPVFAGNYGWEYFYSIENVTNEPFTATRIIEAYIIGEDVVYFSEYGQEQFAQWDFSPELIPGNTFSGGSGANTQQGFEYLGLRVEGLDKDGNALIFAALIPFSQERPQQ